MNLNDLCIGLESLVWSDLEPVVVELGDGGRFHVSEVRQEDGVCVLVLGDWYEDGQDDAEGSYGGAGVDEDAPETRQAARQGAIADNAGLSDLHRASGPQNGAEA